jgi:hypothetical protein
MPEGFRISMMLADSAQSVGGKLYLLGGGWNSTFPGLPGAIAGIVTVPWSETNRKHVLELNLLDDAGAAVRVPTGNGDFAPLQIRNEFEIGRPPGVRPGSSFPNPIAINYLALPLQAGRSYEWRWTIDGQGHDDWRLPFDVRMPPQPGQPPPA